MRTKARVRCQKSQTFHARTPRLYRGDDGLCAEDGFVNNLVYRPDTSAVLIPDSFSLRFDEMPRGWQGIMGRLGTDPREFSTQVDEKYTSVAGAMLNTGDSKQGSRSPMTLTGVVLSTTRRCRSCAAIVMPPRTQSESKASLSLPEDEKSAPIVWRLTAPSALNSAAVLTRSR